MIPNPAVQVGSHPVRLRRQQLPTAAQIAIRGDIRRYSNELPPITGFLNFGRITFTPLRIFRNPLPLKRLQPFQHAPKHVRLPLACHTENSQGAFSLSSGIPPRREIGPVYLEKKALASDWSGLRMISPLVSTNSTRKTAPLESWTRSRRLRPRQAPAASPVAFFAAVTGLVEVHALRPGYWPRSPKSASRTTFFLRSKRFRSVDSTWSDHPSGDNRRSHNWWVPQIGVPTGLPNCWI